MKRTNLILSLIMMVVMAFCPRTARAEVSGVCGTCTWTVADGVLTIGEGTLDAWSSLPPWSDYAAQITKVAIGNVTASTCYGFFAGMSNLTSIEGLGSLNTANVTDMQYMFNGCSSLTSLDFDDFNTANVTNMAYMFSGCSSLTSLDFSNFNTANVTNMTYMFNGCSSLTSLELSDFNTEKVANMAHILEGCSSLESLELGSINMGNVTDMSYMFNGCSKLASIDINSFNTDNVTDMSYMFNGCSSLTFVDISSFNTEKVTNMAYMFNGCSKIDDLYLYFFNTEKVSNMASMFSGCSSYGYLDISSFNTANVTDMSSMFSGCSKLEKLSVGNFNTKKVSNMAYMFNGCSLLTSLELSNFNTANVTDMSNMFKGCSLLTSLDLSTFDTSNVVDFSSMFSSCGKLAALKIFDFHMMGPLSQDGEYTSAVKCDGILDGTPLKMVISTESVPPMLPSAIFPTGVEVFVSSDALEAYKSADYWKQYTLNASNFPETFDLCGTCGWSITDGELDIFPLNGKEGTLDYWSWMPAWCEREDVTEDVTSAKITGTVNAQTCENFFCMLGNLRSIDGLENLKIDNVTSMFCMFDGCSSLPSLDLTSFNTDNVTNMDYMFYDCSSLSSLDLTSFNTDNVTEMACMFYDCSSLSSLDLAGFNTTKVTSMTMIFNGCNLDELILGNFSMQKTSDRYCIFTNPPTRILFKSYPYLVSGAFNSDGSKISLALDDNSVFFTGKNHFPAINDGATYTRSMKNKWGTLVVPFDIDYNNFNGNYRLYYIKEIGDNSISIVNYSNGTIPAGTPLIVRKRNGDGISVESEGNTNFSLAINAASGDDWTMNGTYSALTEQTGMYYITGDKLYPATSPITIPAFRAWIATTSANAKSLTINVTDADGTTSVESVDIDELTTDRGEVYNLSGQRLSAPHKGINIINGKKVNVR